jgi:hypothetical protein
LRAFISHNAADKDLARLLAEALDLLEVDAWFDEWKIRPGDSIAGGIEEGLSTADVFLLLWSEASAGSNWVGAEVNAYLHRRVADETLRIVPVMLDETPLPALVSDYRGFTLDSVDDLNEVAAEIVGVDSNTSELAKRLQRRLIAMQDRMNELMQPGYESGDPLPYIVCPRCASDNLRGGSVITARDDLWYTKTCLDCGWSDASQ